VGLVLQHLSRCAVAAVGALLMPHSGSSCWLDRTSTLLMGSRELQAPYTRMLCRQGCIGARARVCVVRATAAAGEGNCAAPRSTEQALSTPSGNAHIDGCDAGLLEGFGLRRPQVTAHRVVKHH
jgi:hypothetical protein